jgi:nucleotide-binding universal stress UspA family protein
MSESFMFKKILAPVDLTDLDVARPALDQAVELAKASGGEVRMVTIRSIMPVTYMEYVPADFEDRSRAEAETDLKTLEASIALPRDRVSYAVRLGSVYVEILDEAKEWGADLIVIGSHRPSMATYLIGSNAKTIVRHAHCSVLVMR